MGKTQELALTGAEANVPTLTELGATRLWRVCSRVGDKSTWVAHRIAEDAELLGQARGYNAHLQTLQAPIGDTAAARAAKLDAMAPLVALCGRPNFAGPNLEHWWDNWHLALETLPLVAIKEAVRSYVTAAQDTRWPAPGKIVAIANEIAGPVRVVAFRVKLALMLPEATPRPQMSDEQQADMRAKLSGLSDYLRSRRGSEAPPKLPRTPQEAARALREMIEPAG